MTRNEAYEVARETVTSLLGDNVKDEWVWFLVDEYIHLNDYDIDWDCEDNLHGFVSSRCY